MKKYLITRLFQNLLTFILFLTLVFFLMDLQPGDYGNLFLNDPRLTPKMRQALRAGLGLDKPVLERYLIWLKNVFKGDFGISFSNYPRRVIDIIKERAGK
jgi:peptide/nickel transport system permease protein